MLGQSIYVYDLYLIKQHAPSSKDFFFKQLLYFQTDRWFYSAWSDPSLELVEDGADLLKLLLRKRLHLEKGDRGGQGIGLIRLD